MDIKKAFETYYIGAVKRYFEFNGRTSRKAYWMFVLFNVIFSWLAIALDNMFGTGDVTEVTIWGIQYGAFHNFYNLVLMIPGLAIAVRRLHDIGKEWSMMFILLIPVVGWIWMLTLLIKEGDPGENQFGPVPNDEDKYEPGGHPYAPQDSRQKAEDSSQKPKDGSQNVEERGSFDVAAIRKEAEETIAEEPKTEKKEKPKVEKIDRTVKRGRDKGAKDFMSAANKKK